MASTTISTTDGETLEAEINLVEGATVALVITHPNPLMGGDMHAPVSTALWRGAARLGLSALRFNFRGVGQSTGTHDKGGAEQLDVAAAINHLAGAAPDAKLIIGGWSFGADVALTSDDHRVRGWLLAAAPLRVVEPSTMAAAKHPSPKLFAAPSEDQFCPPETVREVTADWTNVEVVDVDGADHFFGGHLDILPELLERMAASVVDNQPT